MAVALFFVTACGASTAENRPPDVTTGKPEPTTTFFSPSVREAVFFPEVRQEGGLDAVPSAQGAGKLVLDDKGCLRMLPGEDPETGWVPVWPPYLEPKTGGEEVRIVDRSNARTVGKVGEEIFMSGGDISKEALRENRILDEETWRELFERCPPGYSYFIVGGGVRVTQRY